MSSKFERKTEIESRFFELFRREPRLWAQAPGRIDLMGSHTDYNQGYVLTQALTLNTWIAAKSRQDRKIRIASMDLPGISIFSLEDIQYDRVFPWSNYVRGVADVFQKEGYPLTGFDGLIQSTIPFGSGLSSSAALEMAVAVLFEALGGWHTDPVNKAILCQRAENNFVGMNCGILDQYSSAMGIEGRALLLDCRTITSEAIPIAPGIQVMICDTRTKRALTGSEYPLRRTQCEEGVRTLSKFYPDTHSLRDVRLDQLETHEVDLDPVVFKRCKFIIEENQRVIDIARALSSGDFEEAGRLTIQSFYGARDLYEIVSDEMIHMFNAITDSPGSFGARGAGAGFGGCLVAFVKVDQVQDFTNRVKKKYESLTGIKPQVFPGKSANGAGILNL